MKKQTQFSIAYYLVAIIILILLQYFILHPPLKEISYKELKERLSKNEIESVQIGNEKIIVTLKKEVAESQKIPEVVEVVKLPDEKNEVTFADVVQKVSIVPRSIGALGYTLRTPTEERYLLTKEEPLGKIAGILGGRAAEEIVFGQISTGAHGKLKKSN